MTEIPPSHTTERILPVQFFLRFQPPWKKIIKKFEKRAKRGEKKIAENNTTTLSSDQYHAKKMHKNNNKNKPSNIRRIQKKSSKPPTPRVYINFFLYIFIFQLFYTNFMVIRDILDIFFLPMMLMWGRRSCVGWGWWDGCDGFIIFRGFFSLEPSELARLCSQCYLSCEMEKSLKLGNKCVCIGREIEKKPWDDFQIYS